MHTAPNLTSYTLTVVHLCLKHNLRLHTGARAVGRPTAQSCKWRRTSTVTWWRNLGVMVAMTSRCLQFNDIVVQLVEFFFCYHVIVICVSVFNGPEGIPIVVFFVFRTKWFRTSFNPRPAGVTFLICNVWERLYTL